MRVETEDGRLVDNVSQVRVDWGGDKSSEWQPTATLTVINIPVELYPIFPGYVRVEMPTDTPLPIETPIDATPRERVRVGVVTPWALVVILSLFWVLFALAWIAGQISAPFLGGR